MSQRLWKIPNKCADREDFDCCTTKACLAKLREEDNARKALQPMRGPAKKKRKSSKPQRAATRANEPKKKAK